MILELVSKKRCRMNALVVLSKLIRRNLGLGPVEVFGSCREVVQLLDERGRQVESDVDVRILLQHGRHVQVVLGGVNAHPGFGVEAGLRILVVDRLVLMPDDGQVERLLRGQWRCWRQWLG